MDISRIQNGPATAAAGTPTRTPARKASSSKSSTPQTPTEPFARSGAATQVQDLVDRLVSGPDLRVDVVEKFRALLEVGEIDTTEAADKAAKAMLDSEA